MNILILGAGGREHVFATKIAESKLCDQLFVAPGNAGTATVAKNINISPTDFKAVGDFCLTEQIEMVVVGPEAPLVAGITDYFSTVPSLKNIQLIGPAKAGAELEGSKDFSKRFMQKHLIPTAAYATFTQNELEDGLTYLRSISGPYVLKADGLAGGKGVVICENLDQAEQTLIEMLRDAKFGKASAKVVIEGFLSGIELSVFVLTDGENYKILPEAKDYKRIGEGDTGLNTGGMGAVSPVQFADAAFMEKVETKVIKPTIEGLKADGIPYQGFIFIGLMNVAGEPFVIEYNVRMGDPETQVVFPRINSDIVSLFKSLKDKTLDQQELKISDETATALVMVAGGYPGEYEKGKLIKGLEEVEECIVFHAGTTEKEGNIVTNGGRVMAVTGKGKDLETALEKAYSGAKKICWEDMYYRKDIGRDLLAMEVKS
ncbi:phosphoribosylamine--glycine ligase [Marivirga sp. S37H4]|uniref:Phosphoribosylamine--glycine ligase n=1 Tax=Marivirga aurantiaca TaxID=2802615 RepID=A0A934X2C0_9BACT|nr:phosphoribosylamine--glycine ligase [Marivirga aurantiaca]MBK6267001.1 phosphoribosylamine--glycine ligase [Marivirga aurantiaca]